MKVTDVRTMVVENEPPYRGGKHLLFVELSTDEGITGLGERITGNTYSANLDDLKSQVNLIQEIGRQFLIGENPIDIEKIWQRAYGSKHDFRHPSLHFTPAPQRRGDGLLGHRGQGHGPAHLQPAGRPLP